MPATSRNCAQPLQSRPGLTGHVRGALRTQGLRALGLLLVVLNVNACEGGPRGGGDAARLGLMPVNPKVFAEAALHFSVDPGPSGGRRIEWSASGGTIDSSGRFVSPNSAGAVVVTALDLESGARTSTLVQVAAVTVAIEDGPSQVLTGGTLQLAARVSGWPETGVSWTTSGGSIDQNGVLTAPDSPGAVVVTATSIADPRRSATTAVAVAELYLFISTQAQAVLAGHAVQLTAIVTGWHDGAVEWSSTAGTIDAAGLLLAPAEPGEVVITATSVADPTRSASAIVSVAQVSVTVRAPAPLVLTGHSLQLAAFVTGWMDGAVSWSASRGTIDGTGLLTAPLTPGLVEVVATSLADPRKSDRVTVDARRLSLSVSPSQAALAPGESLSLTSTVTDWPDTSVIWSVDDALCGTISESGLYLAPPSPPPDTCQIVATSGADTTQAATAAITVANRVSADAGAGALGGLLGAPVFGPGGATAQLRSGLGALVPNLAIPDDAGDWTSRAAALRRTLLDEVVFSGPAAAWRDAPAQVEWLDFIEGGPGYRIRKLRYEALPGLWIPGLLYLPDGLTDRVPAVLHVGGHSPEGKADASIQSRAVTLAKRGVIGLTVDWYWTGQLGAVPDPSSPNDHGRLHQIGLTGASGLAPFYLLLSRALNALEGLPEVDPGRLGVTGLSGGGWQTIWIAALDERVALANPVAGFSALPSCLQHYEDIGDFEQLPVDMGRFADYTHLVALVAPRPLLLTYNGLENCCFDADHALQPLVDAARPAYALLDAPHALREHVNLDPGTHNFGLENREQLYRLVGDTFFPGDPSWPWTEADAVELRTQAELTVELPANNGSLHQLAMQQLAQLPPRSPTRANVAAVIRAHEGWTATLVQASGPVLAGDVLVRQVELVVGNTWRVPAVELVPAGPVGTVVVISEAGRAAAATAASRLLSEHKRVLVADLYGHGEFDVPFLNIMGVTNALGERPLGVAASQLAAIARLVARETGHEPEIVATGPQVSVTALLAAILEPAAIGALDLTGLPASFASLLGLDVSLFGSRYLWCQGLLRTADVDDLVALAGRDRITHH